MNLKNQLLAEHSKKNTLYISNYIGRNAERFQELMAIFSGDNKQLKQRAAWIVSTVGCKYPEVLRPHLSELINMLTSPQHPAIYRNTLKVLADTKIKLSEELEGQLVHQSFEFMMDPKVPIAIQVHAMQCIANLLPAYPDLAIELKTIIEDGMENGSAGFGSRGTKVLKTIAKLKPSNLE